MSGAQLTRMKFEDRYATCLVDMTTGCRLWQGSMDSHGYGKFSGRGAHRKSYEHNVGPIPEGMTVDHICFNRRCVEPTHLRLLTPLANARNHKDRPVLLPENECANGHEYTAENTYIRPYGRRDCRACIRARVKAYRARRSTAAQAPRDAA